ncbi:RNA-directed DNA polymerase from mobile element jockey-like [Aphelenchoides avenae]|nr:RNA-directed DNA polymerase from mobile element jockey-like [Aphelenchus avenae]
MQLKNEMSTEELLEWLATIPPSEFRLPKDLPVTCDEGQLLHELFLECQRPDVVVIVESWLKQDVPDSVLVHKLPYTVYRRDRGSNGGGLVIIVKDCIPSARVRFASAYRPPSYVIEQNDAFFEAITTLMATDEPTVLCGDFNLPGIEWKDGRPSVWHSSARPLVELALSADLRQHVECCVSSLNEYFLSYDWRQDFAEKNASEMYDSFVSVVNSAISEFCCFSSGKKSPGKVPDHILRLQRRQALLWKTRFSSGTAQLLKACSAELKRVTDNCRITDKRRRKPPVDEHGDAIVHDKAQADAFAAHFAAVFNSTVPEESLLPEIGQPRSRIAYCYFTTDEAKLNVTADKISSKMLKLCAESLSLPLCLIFNASMESGIVPELFKEAYVTCLGYLSEENDLLPANQFGFRAKHSVVDALLGSHDDWTQALEEGHHVDCVFVDFSSAFDKLNFILLMHKLKSLGVESYLLQWIDNFLRNRKCMVRIGNTFSEPYSPSSGTPQDLLRRLNGTCTIVAYADDIKLYKVYRPSESTDALQQALDVTEEWSVENDLPLNPAKCIVLH